MDEIKLVTVPKISHRLKELGENVTSRLTELNIEALVATEETLKTLKSLRADLNKELASFEDQRKFVKNGILNPYNEFESIYKSEISDKYKNAVDLLKTKIETVESKIKDEKKESITCYFNELCASEGIDFLSFNQAGIEINLSTSEKAYKDKCTEFIGRVKDDLALIHAEEFEAEIMTEYKRSLNASQSIVAVKDRKERERLEADRIKLAENTRRERLVLELGLKYDSFTKFYCYDPEIYISRQSLETLSKDEFSKVLIDVQERVKVKKSIEAPSGPSQPEMNFSQATAEHLKAPVVSEEIVTASFQVTGTLSQLKALGQYMKDNKITYLNID